MIVQAILRAHTSRALPDSMWGVARVEVIESDDGLRPGEELPAKGDLMRAAAVGEHLKLEAELVTDPKWGRQLVVSRHESLGIQREADAGRWLERLDGVGPVMARRIHAHFQGRILEVLKTDPEFGADPLCEVEGIGTVLAQTIRESWSTIGASGDPETLAYLDSKGLSRWEVNGVLSAAKKRKKSPKEFLETEPYALMEEKGFGFKRADHIALAAGIHREAPARLDAAVLFALETTCAQDTVAPMGKLIDDLTNELTGVRRELASTAIYRVARAGVGVVISEENGVTLVHPRKLLNAERTIFQWATGQAAEEPAGAPSGPVCLGCGKNPAGPAGPEDACDRCKELNELANQAMGRSPSPHHCHAKGCTKPVPPRLLMCAPHWRLVPKELQDRVWATYRPGQEIDKTPTPAYLDAADAAIAAVAKKEGLMTESDGPPDEEDRSGEQEVVTDVEDAPAALGLPASAACNCDAGWLPSQSEHDPWCASLNPPLLVPTEELLARADRQATACDLADVPLRVPAGGACDGCKRNVYEFVDGSVPLTECPNTDCKKGF